MHPASLPLALLLLVAVLLPLGPPASAEAPPCAVVAQVCATSVTLSWTPEPFAVEGTTELEVTLVYKHVPGPATLMAEGPTRLRLAAIPGDGVAVDPASAEFEAEIGGQTSLEVQTVTFTMPLRVTCTGEEGRLDLAAVAEPNGWFVGSEDQATLAFPCGSAFTTASVGSTPLGPGNQGGSPSSTTTRTVPSLPAALAAVGLLGAALALRRL